ncbi:PREDICTED: uncharacterized protein LOC108768268 [Trachymyrmex cornetzi]|uniref:uncharacterized protein LOC108768268 n=1 Tax=Trachymyrmex cornetzi TaxID=471704 RepID=UPI00084F2452|nr:PREDICTED: uncharacterized protein LOC108768268 [Trachymyrmex cornetzi]
MVRQRPLLWDVCLPGYRRTDLKRMHWDQIAEALGPTFTGDMVHKRFQSMESTFRANERKIKATKTRCSGKGTDEIYRPKWEYYESLLFLKKTCAQSDTIDNLSFQNKVSMLSKETNCSPISPPSDVENSSDHTNIHYDENTQEASEHSELHVSSSPNESFVSCNVRQPLSTISNKSSFSSGRSTPLPRLASASLNIKKRSAENPMYVKPGNSKKDNFMEEALDTVKSIAQQHSSPPKMDIFDMFSAYVASRLRSMTPEDQEHYEREILRVLIEPRLQ